PPWRWQSRLGSIAADRGGIPAPPESRRPARALYRQRDRRRRGSLPRRPRPAAARLPGKLALRGDRSRCLRRRTGHDTLPQCRSYRRGGADRYRRGRSCMSLQPEPVAHPDFERQQHALATFNHGRLAPKLSDAADRMSPADEAVWRQCEIDFVEAARAEIAPLLVRLPADADAFIRWYEALKDTGPGQGDALFPWLAESATAGQMRWFMQQE